MSRMSHMRRARRLVLRAGPALAVAAALALASGCATTGARGPGAAQPVLGSRLVPLLALDGLQFRDLDRDGRLSPFEDWRLPAQQRAADLTARLSLREKAGLTMHGTLAGINNPFGASDQGYDLAAVRTLVLERGVTTAITRLLVSPAEMARQNDSLQQIAEQGRLAIPLTISTDPRHHFQQVAGASSVGSGYSQWPEPLGLAALRDPALVRQFADIARSEYRATGIHQALSPQADLYTEPRWSRGIATFGADPALVGSLVRAYVAGFQGSEQGLRSDGVLTVVKHWVGYGAAPNGWDGHNHYGRVAQLDAASFAQHLQAFDGALAVGVGGVMPTYNILDGVSIGGVPLEPVGAGFSKQLIQGLLREARGFDGIVLSDWAILNDCPRECSDPVVRQSPRFIGMPWGVEALSRVERVAKGLAAGLDQFGGASEPDLVVEAVQRGLVSAQRLDASVQRILRSKFQLGLFENPYTDAPAAARVGRETAVAQAALGAQAAAQVLLKNDDRLLPLAAGTRVLLRGLDAAVAASHGLQVVDDARSADVVLVRSATPFETLHPLHFFGAMQHEGRLDFRPGDADLDFVQALPAGKPVVLAVFMDRPAILGALGRRANAVLVNFGAADAAVLAVVSGRAAARGRLPVELPASMAAVEAQHPARPDDSAQPAWPSGAGLVAP